MISHGMTHIYKLRTSSESFYQISENLPGKHYGNVFIKSFPFPFGEICSSYSFQRV